MRILLLNQAFYPDVVASAQYAADLARTFVQQGHQVTVVCSQRAYDSPTRRFPRTEDWEGVQIVRIPCTGFGKSQKGGRVLNFVTFLAACLARILFIGKFDLVVAMTSPPLLSVVAALFARVRRSKLVLWILDLNPDEAFAAGYLKENSIPGRLLRLMHDYSLQHASHTVVMDRFMQERVSARHVPATRITVIPPWSQDESISYDPEGRERFRSAHSLAGRFVVMYSGNHSPCHPLDTILEAAKRLQANPEIAFCFVGGGSEFAKVKAFSVRHKLDNIVCLPYQPRKKLRESLSSADLHLVVMGDPFVGTVHPCKIYNIIALGIPFLYLGPAQSHVEDLIAADNLQNASFSVRHGDAASVVSTVLNASKAAKQLHPVLVETAARFSARILAPKLVAVCESVHGLPAAPRLPEFNSA